jgi:hypothetical protein
MSLLSWVGLGSLYRRSISREALRNAGKLERGEVIFQNLRQLLGRDAAEAAIRRESERGQELARDCKALFEACHAMNEPEIDACVGGSQPG